VDLPLEGTAQLAAMFTRRQVTTASPDTTPAAEALRRRD
jgi:hypothetical protein